MKKKISRFALSILAGIAGLILVLMAWAYWYTAGEEFRSLLREKALAAVRGSVDGEVTFERLSGSIWREIHVSNVSVMQDGMRALFVPRLSVQVSLIRQAVSFLFSSNLHVAKIELEAPVLRLVKGEDGKWNVASLLKEPENPGEKREMTVYLDRIKIDKGRIEATLPDGGSARIAAVALDGSLTLPPDGMRADLADLKFHLSAEGYPETAWDGSFSYEMSGDTARIDVRRLDLRSGASFLRLEGKIEDLAAPKSSVAIEAKRIAAADVRRFAPAVSLRQDFAGRVKIDGPLSALQIAGTLVAADGRLVASALVDLSASPPRYSGTVEIGNLVADRVLEISNVGGTLSATAAFEGAASQIVEASARGSVAGFHVEGWRVGNVALSATLRESALNLNAVAQGQGGKADLKGRLLLGEEPRYEMNVNARGLDLVKAGAKQSLSLPARLNFDLWLKGRGIDLKQADAEAKLTIHPSRIGSIQIARGSAAAALHRGDLNLREARLISNQATFQAQGRLGNLQQDPGGKITYSLRVKEIAPWLDLAGVKGYGAIEAEGTASGTLDALALEGRGKAQRISLGGSSLQGAAARWSLAGIGGPRPRGSIKASVTGVKAGVVLEKLDAEVTLEGAEPAAAQGTLAAMDSEKRMHTVRARIVSSREGHRIDLQQAALRLAGGVWRLSRPAELVVQRETVAIKGFELRRGEPAIRIGGIWSRRGAQDLAVQAKGFPLNELRTFWQSGPRVGGLLDLEAKIAGTAESPVIDASLAAQPITIGGQSYAGFSGSVAYRDERLRLDLLMRQDASHSMSIQGGLPLDLGWAGGTAPAVLGEADLRLKSDGLSPAFLGLFLEDVENIDGALVMDLRLRGPPQELAPQGELHLRRGQGQIKSLGLFIRDVELDTRVAQDRIEVTRLLGRSGDGEITGSGNVALKGRELRSFGLMLQAEDFRVLNRRDLQGAVTGRINASGSLDHPWIRGELTVTESSLRPDLPLFRKGPPPRDPTIVVVDSEEELAVKSDAQDTSEAAKRSDENGFIQRLGLDLGVKIPRNTWVRLDEGEVELAGAVRVGKEPLAPVSLTGAIEILRGSYVFQGKQFRTERGRIVFTGGKQIDPQLNVVARHRAGKYWVEVVIGGTVSKPALTLKSDPPLEQADVLSVLLFGKPIGGLSESQQTGLRSQAIKTTADFVASDLRQSVARRLGVDSLDFEFGENIGEGRVAVGKYVTDDVFVSASQGIGKEREQGYSVEYELAPNWRLKSSTTTGGESGIDLIWRKEY